MSPPVIACRGRNTSTSPRKICDVITPELPRAPISEPRPIAWQTSSIDSLVVSSLLTDSSVNAMFVPVSPSGTG